MSSIAGYHTCLFTALSLVLGLSALSEPRSPVILREKIIEMTKILRAGNKEVYHPAVMKWIMDMKPRGVPVNALPGPRISVPLKNDGTPASPADQPVHFRLPEGKQQSVLTSRDVVRDGFILEWIIYNNSGMHVPAGQITITRLPFWMRCGREAVELPSIPSGDSASIQMALSAIDVPQSMRSDTVYYNYRAGLTEVIGFWVIQCPNRFSEDQVYNFPNPFNGLTSITYLVASPTHAELKVVDLLGRDVKRLVDGMLRPGLYSITWDATGYAGGVYFLIYRQNAITSLRKILYVP